MCTSEYNVPVRIVQQPYGGWYMYCDCQEEGCGNVQFDNVSRAVQFAQDMGDDVMVQPCLGAS